MNAVLKKYLKAARDAARSRKYHARHSASAMQIARDLASWGKQVRPADAKRCKDYAIEVLGAKHYTAWLLAYSAVSGRFQEGWIPDNFYGAKVVPSLNGTHGKISALKSFSSVLFDHLPDLGSQINGSLFDGQFRRLSFDDARTRFFQGHDRIIFKSDSSGRGTGIYFFDQRSFDRHAVERLGDGVFQRFISQHALFDRFTDASVATIRITTAAEASGKITPRAANLRLGSGSDTHVQSRSQVRVALDLASGQLDDKGFLANWRECSSHPTSGEPFAGKKIPAFEQCLGTVVSLHQRVPFVGCIGWDLTVDSEERVQLLEWNGSHNGIKFSEAAQGPCFKGLGWERMA